LHAEDDGGGAMTTEVASLPIRFDDLCMNGSRAPRPASERATRTAGRDCDVAGEVSLPVAVAVNGASEVGQMRLPRLALNSFVEEPDAWGALF
jgi:hypothetical protein